MYLSTSLRIKILNPFHLWRVTGVILIYNIMDHWKDIYLEQPEKGQDVLGFRPFAHEWGDSNYTVLKYNGGKFTDHRGISYGFERCHHVSHWKPLLNPVTGEQNLTRKHMKL